ncbi:MAG: TonB-dependent receptor [Ahrensia sp.]|nr:TonB-dependent receptor [Ahrensia sp.]
MKCGFGQDIDGIFLSDDKLSYKVTGFYNEVTNLIARGTNNDFMNVGAAKLYGVELEGNYDSERFFTSVAASLIRGENAQTGAWLPNIAPDEVSLTIGGKLPEQYLRFGWDARFAAAQTRVPVGTTTSGLRYQGFNKHDVFVSWKPQEGMLKGLEATARVENLFNQQYQEYLDATGPAKGRTFKASLGYTIKF